MHADPVGKYIHMAVNNAPCRWKDINMHNLSNAMSVEQAKDCLERVRPQVIKQYQGKVDHLTSLEAPEVIMERYVKLLTQAKADKVSELACLTRRIKKGGA